MAEAVKINLVGMITAVMVKVSSSQIPDKLQDQQIQEWENYLTAMQRELTNHCKGLSDALQKLKTPTKSVPSEAALGTPSISTTPPKEQ